MMAEQLNSLDSEDSVDAAFEIVVRDDTPERDHSGESVTMNQSETDDQQPSLHSYLTNGKELEVVRGRTVFEDSAVITLDLLQAADVVLMPGQTLPLTVFDHSTKNMLKNCIRKDRTFGVLANWTSSDGTHYQPNNIGTTAEIYEYLPEEGSAGFRVKARARQRFKVLEFEANGSKAKVCILPEVRLPHPLEGVKLQSLYRYRTSPQGRYRCRKLDAAVTRWPAFVYEQYDVQRLVDEMKRELRSASIVQKETDRDKEKERFPVKVIIPDDPTELSFWVAQNMPIKESHRIMMLRLNSPIQRLRWALKALKQSKQTLHCHRCMNTVGSSDDIFPMSVEGPQSTYVNPGGYLHETITLYKVINISTFGFPSTEFSWFPGYAWSMCKCNDCNQHMGWMFTATKESLYPTNFWGICRRAIAFHYNFLSEDQCCQFYPVM